MDRPHYKQFRSFRSYDEVPTQPTTHPRCPFRSARDWGASSTNHQRSPNWDSFFLIGGQKGDYPPRLDWYSPRVCLQDCWCEGGCVRFQCVESGIRRWGSHRRFLLDFAVGLQWVTALLPPGSAVYEDWARSWRMNGIFFTSSDDGSCTARLRECRWTGPWSWIFYPFVACACSESGGCGSLRTSDIACSPRDPSALSSG